MKDTLATLTNANAALVWAEHMPDWRRAGDMAELRAQIGVPLGLSRKTPPPLPTGNLPPIIATWRSMKRGFLFGFTSFLDLQAISALLWSMTAFLFFLAASAAAVQAARKGATKQIENVCRSWVAERLLCSLRGRAGHFWRCVDFGTMRSANGTSPTLNENWQQLTKSPNVQRKIESVSGIVYPLI